MPNIGLHRLARWRQEKFHHSTAKNCPSKPLANNLSPRHQLLAIAPIDVGFDDFFKETLL
jgi:hypothetical protein